MPKELVEAHVVAKNTIIVKALKGEKCVTVHMPLRGRYPDELAEVEQEARNLAWASWEAAFGDIRHDLMQAVVSYVTLEVVYWLREVE